MYRRICRRDVTFGIRREQKGKWERRAPISPQDAKSLLKQSQCDAILVQPSSKRIFTDEEFSKAGCKISEDLSKADFIMGIKEVPVEYLIPAKKYLFFSHTHKGQTHNMPMLNDVLQKKIHLMDYELLVDDKGRRLVAFGKYAGNAGMINILHGLGLQFLDMGYSTPFLQISRAFNYFGLSDAKKAIANAGESITKFGIPTSLNPVVFTFTGDGNVAQGAFEIFQQLPHEIVNLKQLHNLIDNGKFDNRKVYGVQLKLEEYLERINGGSFDLQEFFKYGKQKYTSKFHEKVLPFTTCLVHGSYWDDRYPVLVVKKHLDELMLAGDTKLKAIADISCDINGGIEITSMATTIENPFFMYTKGKSNVMLMSIDNLPAELSRDSSFHFSNCLTPILADYLSGKPKVMDNATIAKDGQVYAKYADITKNAIVSSKKKRVLLLGSGRVALPIVDHFLSRKDVELSIGSNSMSEIESLLKAAKSGQTGAGKVVMNVQDENSLMKHIGANDLVISFVPAFLHTLVAQICVKLKKNMITASYVTPEIASLDEQAKATGVVILNEMGLDPGIDHLLAMKVIDDVNRKGGRISSFVSWCGGLPAPENSNNPFGYKFSWSPRGVLTASMNAAMFKRDGRVVNIQPGNILDQPFSVDIFKGFNFEGLPNRDSLKYSKVYHLQLENMRNMFRGTLRYKGFSEIMAAIRDVGLLDQKAILRDSHKTWADVLRDLMKTSEIEQAVRKRSAGDGKADQVINAFDYLGLFTDPIAVPESKLLIDALSSQFASKLKYETGERDMVCLHHSFGVRMPNSDDEHIHTESLVAYGDVDGSTAMAKTVALPAAYAADLILDGKISEKGVILPTSREIYEPVLKRLSDQMTIQSSLRE